MSSFTLQGSAYITGAGSGIGRAVAHAFVKNGVSQIALGDINEQTAQETADQLKSINKDVNAIAIQVDVANEDSVKASIETATAAFGRIDFAVNNAGINGPLGLASDVSFEDWKKTIDINLSGVWLCQRAEITQMLLQEPVSTRQYRGAIVNVSSMLGINGIWSETPPTAYSACKHGIVGLTKTDANTVASKGIRINAICPGFVSTPILKLALDMGYMDEQIAATPMKRVATPEEVADGIVFLVSPASSFMTGSALVMDG
ncbi:uncharacterized protein TRUGW13939_10593 [Talaromyces rugulosus]|uniref:Uncharacterized protein n=1 Tax=Talaromyces rugulosus TaxID=121627 RepID=A0A7H8RFU4_TALRU|nr:uncharacterized protein TRUGW13939_10593 [Talaromyces rugulosus]QKX63423.1 hypothetical protein TRUGW13939_10593 [Talaromyces rugulosus]